MGALPPPARPYPGQVTHHLRGASRQDVQRQVEAILDAVERTGGVANFTQPIVLEDRTWAASGTVVLIGGAS